MAALVFGVLAATAAGAHGLDPASLTLRETAPGAFAVTWRASALRLPGADVQPILPPHCQRRDPAEVAEGADHVILRWTIDCGPEGLDGQIVGVSDLAAAKINALLTIERIERAPIRLVLGPRETSFTVPQQAGSWDVVRSYLALGIEHILGGPDHLLFVFGLLLLVSASRLLVQTITAFTVGHSITLSAAALGYASVPSRPVEVLIALSVLLLAVELTRGGGRPSLLRRFPWAMAVAFGLLHGFGFAGALAEAGLNGPEIPLALVSFNAGIEIGQLFFVAAVVLAGYFVVRWAPRMAGRSARPAAYAMGILAAFWCFERVAVWLG